jgi:hypothetical protein
MGKPGNHWLYDLIATGDYRSGVNEVMGNGQHAPRSEPETEWTNDPVQAARQVVDRTMNRAGVDVSPEARAALAETLAKGGEHLGTNPGVQQLEALMLLGDPAQEPGDLAGIELFGRPAEEIRANMTQGYKGRGWNQAEIDALGREPFPRELSEGSRQHYEWTSDKEFLDEMKKVREGFSLTLPWNQPPKPLGAASRWSAKQNQQYGTSGWAGAMENPEYGFGHLNNHYLSPTPNGLMYQSRGERESGDNRWVLQRLMDKWDNEAEQYTDMTDLTNRVSPPLPGNPQTWQEKEQQFQKLKSMAEAARPMSYDDHHRRTEGFYPSYFGSGAREMVENSADISTFASLGYSGILSAAAKETGKQATKAAVGAIGRDLLQEEIPQYAAANMAISSAMKADANAQAGPGNEPFNHNPGWIQSFLPGAENRPDTWIRDEQTRQFRPETNDEFNSRYDQQALDQKKAFAEWQAMQGQVPTKPNPLSGLTQPK